MATDVPERFNLSRYCLTGRADPEATALIVVHGAAGLEQLEGARPAGDGAAVERWTFAELDDAVRRVASGLLNTGLEPGDRVMIRLGNTTDYPLVHFGAMAAGLISLPSSDQLGAGEVRFLLEDAGAAALVHDDDLDVPDTVRTLTPADVSAWRSQASPIPYRDTAAEDPAFLVYTSGTTNRPKGVLHAHRSAWGRRPMYAGWYGMTSSDVMLHAGAFNWTYTLGVGLTDPWACGARSVVLVGDRDRRVWSRLIRATGATMFAAVPGLYRQILAADADGLSELRDTAFRHGLVAGEALPQATREAWEDVTGTPLHEALGMSECSTFVSSSPTTPVRAGSPGRAQPGRRIAVLAPDGTELSTGEVGLLAVDASDPGLMLGYWNRPGETPVRDGWFVTSDLVELDEDGYVVYHGRADDVVTAGGYRISPAEVEDALLRATGVEEVAVTAMEIRPGVQVVAAFVVVAAGHSPEEVRRAIDTAASEIAAYKRPREVVFVDGLPRTRNGKVIRRDLRDARPGGTARSHTG